MNENCDAQVPTPANLDRWQEELGFTGTLLTDPAREVYSAYADANSCGSGPTGCSNAVSVLIDRTMTIRHFGSTYACGRGDGNMCGMGGVQNDPDCVAGMLEQIEDLLAE